MEFYFQMLITRAKLRPFALSVESCSVVQLQSFIESPTYNVYKQVYMRKCIFEVFIVGKSFQTGQKQCAPASHQQINVMLNIRSSILVVIKTSAQFHVVFFKIYFLFMSLIHRGVKVLLRCCWNNNNNNKKKSFRPKYKQIICQNVSGNNNQRVSLMLIHLYILSLTKKNHHEHHEARCLQFLSTG